MELSLKEANQNPQQARKMSRDIKKMKCLVRDTVS